MNFDLVTAFLITGILYILVPALVWNLLSDFQMKTTDWWCGGGILIGIGTIWVSMAAKVVPYPYYGLMAAVMASSGIFLKIRTLRTLLQRSFSTPVLVFWVLVYVVLEIVADSFEGLRALYFTSTQTLLYFYIAWLALKLHLEFKVRNVLWISLSYAVVAILLLLMSLPLEGKLPNHDLWEYGLPAALLAILGIVIVVINNIAYMGMVLEKSRLDQKSLLAIQNDTEKQGVLRSLIMDAEMKQTLAKLAYKLMHEIRQPLTSLGSGISLLRRAWLDNRFNELDMNALIGRLDRSLTLANEVVKQINPLAVSKERDLEIINLAQVVDDALAVIEVQNDTVQILRTYSERLPFSVSGNRIELTQIVVNLVRNAMQAAKLASKQPQVRIALKIQNDQACVVVADNGTGFTDEGLRKAGREIYTTRQQGMGLGLWICQEIASNNGGQLHFANSDGAEVTLAMPRAKNTFR